MQVDLDAFEAARSGNLQALRDALARRQGRIDANDRGETILMCSAKNGHEHCIEEILRNPGYEGRVDKMGRTALMHAAINGHATCVSLLCPEEKHKQDTDGITALMHAIIHGQDHIVSLLVDEAPSQAQGSVTTLMIAAEYDNIPLIKQLMEKQRGLHDSNGWTALMYAIQGGACNAVELLYKEEWKLITKDEMSALMIAAMIGRVEAVRLLASMPCQDWQDKRGMTALMYAADNGFTDCVELLKGSSHIVDNLNRTALMYAASKGHTDCVSILLETPDIFDSNGRNALMHAADSNSLEAIRVILARRPSLDFQRHEEAMILAAKHGYSECLEALFAARPAGSRNLIDCYWSAILAAAVYGYEACLRVLARDNESVFLTVRSRNLDRVALSALDIAVCMGYTKCVECLLDYPNRDRDRMHDIFNPLKHAANRGYTDIVRLLISRQKPIERVRGGPFNFDIGKTVSEAAKNGRPECLQLMLNEYSNGPSKEVLYYTCQGGYIKCARILMSSSSTVATRHFLDFRQRETTPLMAAARSGFYECAKFIVEYFVRERDSEGNPAIRYAILSVAINCVELLSSYERVTPCFDEGLRYLPIDLARKYDLSDCVELL
ncbi:Ankyrin repeat protein 1 [Giardia muris]|uniref:Ankyrin repeat protein 1 n=1 Tax=Giardia muris TaxID=5742 RepID=A0A4Z1T177_GIAMU|nr:Ankyrin repeat protein 1 [Giardia muris]|eukprot:TNJ30725.1 Ankyrin repeat protein 1 [Giardia muris]